MIHLLFYTPKHFFLYGALYVNFTVLIKQDYIFETMTKATGNVFLLLCCTHTGTAQPDSCSLLGDLIIYYHCFYNPVLLGKATNVPLWFKFGQWLPHRAWSLFDALSTADTQLGGYVLSKDLWKYLKSEKKKDCTNIQNRNWSKLAKVQMSTKHNKW